MLLPDAFAPTHAPELLVALDANRQLIGAAAIAWAAAGDPPALPVAVHVLPPWRRRGVGRALVNAAASMVEADARAITPWTKPDESSDAAKFCIATEFTLHHRVFHFTAVAAEVEAALARYREKLDRAGWIPNTACIVPLPEAPAPAVAHLVCRQFGSSEAAILSRILGRSDPTFDQRLSVVLLLDGVVVGAQMVSRGADGVPEVEANVVSPTLRRGWANLLLTHEGTRLSVACGTQRFRFSCDERVIDTLNIARRSGAELARTELAMIRPVPSAG